MVSGQRAEEGDVGALSLEDRRLGSEVDGLESGLAWAGLGADLDADAAAGAVVDVDLQVETDVRVAARVDRRRLESGRRGFERALVVVLAADHAVGAGEAALAALHGKVVIP